MKKIHIGLDKNAVMPLFWKSLRTMKVIIIPHSCPDISLKTRHVYRIVALVENFLGHYN